MVRVKLSVYFDEQIQMPPEEAEAVVVGVFERNDIDATLVREDDHPRAYDVQDSQVDVLVEVDGQENPVQAARLALNEELANGPGAPADHISGKRA